MFGKGELGLVWSSPGALANVSVVAVDIVIIKEVAGSKTFPSRSSRLGLILLSREGFGLRSGSLLALSLNRLGANVVCFPNGLQFFVVRAEYILGITGALYGVARDKDSERKLVAGVGERDLASAVLVDESLKARGGLGVE